MFLAIELLIISLLVIGCMSLWSKVILATRGSHPHDLTPEPRLAVPLGLVDLMIAAFLFLGGQVFGVVVAMILMGTTAIDFTTMPPDQQIIFNFIVGIAQILSTAVAAVFLALRYQTTEAIGGSFKFLAQDVRLGCIIFVMFAPLTFLTQTLLTLFWEYEHPTIDMISPASPWLAVASAWWVAVIVAPITEEILFRGVLQGWLSRLAGPFPKNEFLLIGGWPNAGHQDLEVSRSEDGQSDHDHGDANAARVRSIQYVATSWAPTIVSAVLFGLVHLGQGPAPISIGVFGIGLGLAYRKTGRLIPSIVAHFLLNFLAMSTVTIQVFFFPETLDI